MMSEMLQYGSTQIKPHGIAARKETMYLFRLEGGLVILRLLKHSLYFFLFFLIFICLFCHLGSQLWHVESCCVVWDLFHYGTQILQQLHGLAFSMACGILVPLSGIEPVSPALQGGFLTTRPSGKGPTSISQEWKEREGLYDALINYFTHSLIYSTVTENIFVSGFGVGHE